LASSVGFRYQPPQQITPNGSWKMGLRMEDRDVRRAVVAPLDLRSFSYRPVAAFVALAAASTRRRLRRNVILWGGGLGLMLVLTTLFSALPVLSRYGAKGSLGWERGSRRSRLIAPSPRRSWRTRSRLRLVHGDAVCRAQHEWRDHAQTGWERTAATNRVESRDRVSPLGCRLAEMSS